MTHEELGKTYAGRLAMAFATALSGDEELFSPPKRHYSVATLRRYFKDADKAIGEALRAGNDAAIDAAVDERERWLNELEAAGVDVYHDKELWA